MSRERGCFNGGVFRIISDIRLKHGPNAVNLDNCGKFVLSDDLSDIADMTHIDLSGINSLEGRCYAVFVRLQSSDMYFRPQRPTLPPLSQRRVK